MNFSINNSVMLQQRQINERTLKMYLFSKIYDVSVYTDDFHFFYTPIDCDSLKNFFRFLTSTVLLIILSIGNRKLVYYSSEAVTKEKSLYSTFKFIHECILRKTDLILRIPRVYSKDRNKGLIGCLKNRTFVGDKSKIIEYITDEDFRDFFIRNMNYHGIIKYDRKYRYDSIFNIEKKFAENN